MLVPPVKSKFERREFSPFKNRGRLYSDLNREVKQDQSGHLIEPKSSDVRKRKSLLSRKKLILDPREEPLRDSIQKSNAKLEQPYPEKRATIEAIPTKYRAFSMINSCLNSPSLSPKKYRFVDPLTLPEKKSPTRYGNYLVRVFDGDLSQTKQQYIKKTFPHNSKNKYRKSFLIPQKGFEIQKHFDSTVSSSNGSVDSNSSSSKVKSFRQKLLAELKNSLFKSTAKNSMSFKFPSPPSIISEREGLSQAPTPENIMSQCPSPTKTEYDQTQEVTGSGNQKKQRRTYTSGLKSKKTPLQIEGRVRFPSFANKPSFSQQSSRKYSMEQKFRRTSGDSTIYAKTKRRLKFLMNECKENLIQNQTCQTEPVSGIMTPLIQGEASQMQTEASKSPRQRINGIHQLIMLGRRCKVNMGEILKRELSYNDQHERHAERIYYELMKRVDHSNSYVREQVQTFHLKKPLPGLRSDQSYEEF